MLNPITHIPAIVHSLISETQTVLTFPLIADFARNMLNNNILSSIICNKSINNRFDLIRSCFLIQQYLADFLPLFVHSVKNRLPTFNTLLGIVWDFYSVPLQCFPCPWWESFVSTGLHGTESQVSSSLLLLEYQWPSAKIVVQILLEDKQYLCVINWMGDRHRYSCTSCR